MVISQKFQTTRLFCLELDYVKNYLELNHLALIYGRVFEDVEVEGSADVLVGLLLPSVGTDTHLEGIHSDAVVAQLLISIS